MTSTLVQTPSWSQARRIAARYRALADQTRLRILLAMAGRKVCVCELVDELGISQPLLSFHLRSLRSAGLVRSERRGRWNDYALDPAGLEAAEGFLSDLVAEHAAAAGPAVTCCG
jgi:ArsR family transcriptional regulator